MGPYIAHSPSTFLFLAVGLIRLGGGYRSAACLLPVPCSDLRGMGWILAKKFAVSNIVCK